MDKFSSVTSVAVPLRRTNVDTDQIIPAVFLKRISKTGFEDALFFEWRKDPDFVLNKTQYRGSQILVAGADFGTGSSREHAVWALKDYGFRVVISSRFGDIFRGNSAKQGLVAVEIGEESLAQLWETIEANPLEEVTVDLDTQMISCAELRIGFDIDQYTKWRLIEGLDDIALTLRDEQKISDFESKRDPWKPQTLNSKPEN